MVSVVTRSFDNYRTGANTAETALTHAAVSRGLRKVASILVPNDARGSEAAPLYVQSIAMSDGLTHAVVFGVSMGGYAYAADAITGQNLWQVKICNPVVNLRTLDTWMIQQYWSFISTPVLNLAKGEMYAVGMTSTDGTIATAAYKFFVITLSNGAIKSAISIDGASYKPPAADLPTQSFKTVARKQRSALTLVGNVVFFGCGSFNEDVQNQGYVIAIDISGATPVIMAAWTSCPRWQGGGIWMAGQGLAVLRNGDLLFLTGNGGFDGITDYGECVVRLRYSPSTIMTSANFSVVGYWSPFTDASRVDGRYPTLASANLIPGYNANEDPVGNASNMNGWNDLDLGSGGVLVMPMEDTGYTNDIILVAGKDGVGYLLNPDKLGNPKLADYAPDRMQQYVNGCLLSPPFWLTTYSDAAPNPTDMSKLDVLVGGKTKHQHATPVYHKSPTHGPMFFVWGENSPLKAWSISAAGVPKYLACSDEIASVNCGNPGGMPGGMMALSSNNGQDAILWASIPYGDANKTISNGRFLGYDAENFVNGRIVPLYDSEKVANVYTHNKFNIPVPANGKVFLPNYSGGIDIYAPIPA